MPWPVTSPRPRCRAPSAPASTLQPHTPPTGLSHHLADSRQPSPVDSCHRDPGDCAFTRHHTPWLLPTLIASVFPLFVSVAPTPASALPHHTLPLPSDRSSVRDLALRLLSAELQSFTPHPLHTPTLIGADEPLLIDRSSERAASIRFFASSQSCRRHPLRFIQQTSCSHHILAAPSSALARPHRHQRLCPALLCPPTSAYNLTS